MLTTKSSIRLLHRRGYDIFLPSEYRTHLGIDSSAFSGGEGHRGRKKIPPCASTTTGIYGKFQEPLAEDAAAASTDGQSAAEGNKVGGGKGIESIMHRAMRLHQRQRHSPLDHYRKYQTSKRTALQVTAVVLIHPLFLTPRRLKTRDQGEVGRRQRRLHAARSKAGKIMITARTTAGMEREGDRKVGRDGKRSPQRRKNRRPS